MAKPIKVQKNCTGCTACICVCPQNAIVAKEDNNGFIFPVIDNQKCVNCGLCNTVCPIVKKKSINVGQSQIYAVVNTDDNIRMNSSSGGAFYEIASHFIDVGGIVYGVAMSDDSKKAEHIKATTKSDLLKILGSKYLQSDITGIFYDVKSELKKGTKVLFSGTPCQVNGLKAYLRTNYDNLFTVDFVCHGVPSPKVWRSYIGEKQKDNNCTVTSVSFRNKISGWKKYSLKIDYSNGKTEYSSVVSDPYLKAFVHNLTMRESCFDCQFRKIHRKSDITLADCWGSEYYLKDYNDDKGITAVIIHSDKAEDLLLNLENLKKLNVDFDDFIRYNPSLINNIPHNFNRKYFFRQFSKTPEKTSQILVECDSRITVVGRICGKLYS
ncbi:MAG: Coenzyme F420 hydrogenase/dehydrogenase, beta subunit C-terminal domain, partial [bacterium]|nr:Coenzyme F420 hydrogenase/dehydrogenase, beta subunit C-terminal domain [bacterium]